MKPFAPLPPTPGNHQTASYSYGLAHSGYFLSEATVKKSKQLCGLQQHTRAPGPISSSVKQAHE